ncbi:MAG: glycosyltransferase family 39 protein [Candidatus Eisenbacteria bacterium]|uniref:Glycosyltransferase family 39 protein n=1 Tax=Eiseniibacteriota bacterium TaxID=2212470 RepID=A0A933SET2_UNCEI|nr:glycosyltransferase family 39 protein [Candidatus Eisenbacteria bacterium]
MCAATLKGPSFLDRHGLLVTLVLALAARAAIMGTNAGITMDSPLYVRMAEDLLAGVRGPSPAHHGYPMLVAAASRVIPGREWPGRITALLAALTVAALAWSLARRHLGPRGALVAAALVALHPLLVVYGGAIMTEAPFLAFTLAGLALLEGGRPFAGGLALGAAYWIRPEAAVIAPVAAALVRGREAKLRVLAGAACAALPYLAFLRWELGWWSLTPKTALVRAPFESARAAEWTLADSSATADSVGVLARLRTAGPEIARGFPAQLAAHGGRWLQAWPLPWLALSFAGIAAAWRGAPRAALLAPLAPFFVLPLLAAPVDVRFAHVAIPSLALAAALGLAAAWRHGALVRGAALAAAAAGALLLATGPLPKLALHFDDGPMHTLRGAGERLRALATPGQVVMDRKAYVPFFAGLKHAQLPDEPLDTLLDWARTSGADYLVVEEYVAATVRPQLLELLDPARLANERRVTPLFVLRPAPGEGVAVFRVERDALGAPPPR